MWILTAEMLNHGSFQRDCQTEPRRKNRNNNHACVTEAQHYVIGLNSNVDGQCFVVPDTLEAKFHHKSITPTCSSSLLELGARTDENGSDAYTTQHSLQMSAFTLPHTLPSSTFVSSEEYRNNRKPANCTSSLLNLSSQKPTANAQSGNFLDRFLSRSFFDMQRKTSSSNSLSEELYSNIWSGSITLRRTAKPNLQNERHRENSLRLSILEARNLPTRRRYYCDICLDRILYARTTSKAATASGIFWAEDLDLNNLPMVSVVTISLYREADSGKDGRGDGRRFSKINVKRGRKYQNQLIGFVTIPTSEMMRRNDVQAWLALQPPMSESVRDLSQLGYPISSSQSTAAGSSLVRWNSSSVLASSNAPSQSSLNLATTTTDADAEQRRNLPHVRIRARYRSIDVLPIQSYYGLRALIIENGLLLTAWLEPMIPVKMKEEFSSSLVGLLEYNGQLVDLLTKMVVRDVGSLENEAMTFRSNTIATKAVECYVKLVGWTYLHDLLYRLVRRVLACLTAWEVNPEKLAPNTGSTSMTSLTMADTTAFARAQLPDRVVLPSTEAPPGSLMANQMALLLHLHLVWRAIQLSLPHFPGPLVRLFSSFRFHLEPSRGAEFCDNLISGCIFLRLICPALLSPSLFGLVCAYPDEPSCQRNLTLLAKSLQSMANFSAFTDKEPYMRFLNGYVSEQLPLMRTFIRSISSGDITGMQEATGGDDINQSVAHATKFKEDYQDLIDEGFELANLHLILSDLCGMDVDEINTTSSKTSPVSDVKLLNNIPGNENLPTSLAKLPLILRDISNQLVQASGTSSRTKKYQQPTVNQANNAAKSQRKSSTTSNSALLDSDTAAATSYYTLHQNPGFCKPTAGGGQQVGSAAPLSILSAQLIPTDNKEHSQNDPLAAAFNANDYDEPYQTDSDEERVSLTGKQNTVQTQSEVSKLAFSLGGVQFLNPTQQNEEPIYDHVPSSDGSGCSSRSSSIGRMMQTKSEYVKKAGIGDRKFIQTVAAPSSGASVIAESKQAPSQKDRLNGTEPVVVDSSNQPIEPTQQLRITADKLLRSDQRLSPRMFPKQVAKAEMLLTKKPIITNLPSEGDGTAAVKLQTVTSGTMAARDKTAVYPADGKASTDNSSKRLPVTAKSPLGGRSFNAHQANYAAASSCTTIKTTDDANYADRSTTKDLTSGADATESEELTELRRKLQLSEETASQAVTRLSQQEAEITRLRQLLQMTSQTAKQVGPSTKMWSSIPRENDGSNAVAYGSGSVPAGYKEGADSKNTATTFGDLDDAMARLAIEQDELNREQERIRARLNQTRPVDLSGPQRKHPALPGFVQYIGDTSSRNYAPPSVNKSPRAPLYSGGSGSNVTPKTSSRVRHNALPQPRNKSSSSSGRP